MSEEAGWERGLSWAWSNWDTISKRLGGVYRWFKPDPTSPAGRPGILIIGPGGAGKTTLAHLLSGDSTGRLFEEPWRYDESISEERFTLSDSPGVEVVVPPGQPSRREAAWADVTADLSIGKYRGVILVVAHGWTTLPSSGSYKEHPDYQSDKKRFIEDRVRRQREEEMAILRALRPALSAASGKMWLLLVICKQDLWWPERKEVSEHYAGADWQAELSAVRSARGTAHFRDEQVGCSLVIASLTDAEGNLLRPNAVGYDQKRQVESERRLFEVLDGLREWEGE